MRTQGGGAQKSVKFCGRPLWTAPNDISSPTNRPSTLPIYKPGKPYFYPALKIHKLNVEDLKPGVDPPARLITALQEGVTKRADVFLCKKYLKPLEEAFCKDTLKDTTDTLIWLDEINKSMKPNVKKNVHCFTFDFKNLYDSISTDLVVEALNHAMQTCKPEWDTNTKIWINGTNDCFCI